MDSSVSPKDEIWFLRVCHHISNAVYKICNDVTVKAARPTIIRPRPVPEDTIFGVQNICCMGGCAKFVLTLPWPVPAPTRTKAWVCGHSLAGIAGSNLAREMDVSLLWVLWVLSGRDLCVGLNTRPEESYRVCKWVWLWSLDNEESLAHWRFLHHGRKTWCCHIHILRVQARRKQKYMLMFQYLKALWNLCFQQCTE